jgi:hypothetical protein
MRTHLREVMGDKFFKYLIAPKNWTAFTISKYYW